MYCTSTRDSAPRYFCTTRISHRHVACLGKQIAQKFALGPRPRLVENFWANLHMEKILIFNMQISKKFFMENRSQPSIFWFRALQRRRVNPSSLGPGEDCYYFSSLFPMVCFLTRSEVVKRAQFEAKGQKVQISGFFGILRYLPGNGFRKKFFLFF